MDANSDVSVKTVIGLEVHVQLLTRTKLFCGCGVKFGMPPNSQTCPVCIGMPGVLPVMNGRAFELALKAAAALRCQIAPFTKWDRKNYYYPDLPKNYQVSQYDLPFASGGGLDIVTDGGAKHVRLIRVHLEEDAGKNTHSETGGDSLVDLNRAGTPLLEIVTEPDMTSPAEAKAFLETIRTLLIDQHISDCEMQEGSMRCDANINLHITHQGKLYKTPIVEIKNMNSMRSVERALHHEADEQLIRWRRDGKVLGDSPKQTRGWDENRGVTRMQREKEEASDYRYFPEPDLVPVVVESAWIDRIRAAMGETSAERSARYQRDHGLSAYAADVLVEKGQAVHGYFDALVALSVEPVAAANWLINDVLSHAVGRLRSIDDLPIAPAPLAELIGMVHAKKLNLNDAREKVLPQMLQSGKPASVITRELGLEVVADLGAIEGVVDEVLREQAKAVEDYRGGKEKAFGSLVGQVMRRGKGKFPPSLVNDVLLRKLKGQ